MEAGVASLANALVHASLTLDAARRFLHEEPAVSDDTVLNGHMFSATVALDGLLDGFAALANRAEPQQVGPVTFLDHVFMHSDFVSVVRHQVMISKLRYGTSTFAKCAENVKHGCPWVGCASLDDNTKVWDVYDGEGRGYVYDVLIPVHNALVDMVQEQATRRGQSIPELWTL